MEIYVLMLGGEKQVWNGQWSRWHAEIVSCFINKTRHNKIFLLFSFLFELEYVKYSLF